MLGQLNGALCTVVEGDVDHLAIDGEDADAQSLLGVDLLDDLLGEDDILLGGREDLMHDGDLTRLMMDLPSKPIRWMVSTSSRKPSMFFRSV